LNIFISHDWDDEREYFRATTYLDSFFPEGWRDLSAPRSRAIALARTKRGVFEHRVSALSSERYGLVERNQKLELDLASLAALASSAGSGSTLRIALEGERRKLEAFSPVLPNQYARERYLAQPMAELHTAERAFSARGLLDHLTGDASRTLANELIAVQSSIAAVDQVLSSVREEQERLEADEELVTLPATSFADYKMPANRKLTIDRLLAEQLSALVAQSNIVLLLIGDFGMFKPWIHFELHWLCVTVGP